jgi:protease I
MAEELKGKRLALVATDGFEQPELTEPREALKREGAVVDIVAPKSGRIQGMRHHERGDTVPVDHIIDEVVSDEYAGLVLPGGVANPDTLRLNPKVIGFVREFFEANKPVAAICHGAWTLVEADVGRGRTITSWPSLKTDLKNAGANWVDQEVVVDNGLVTSRRPDDLPAFCQKMVDEFRKGHHP